MNGTFGNRQHAPVRRQESLPPAHARRTLCDDQHVEQLPYIDEHAVSTAASRDAVWSALTHVLSTTMTGATWFLRLLRTDPASATSTFDGNAGDAVPGFRVAKSEPGHSLTLRGHHRFSHYQLSFLIDDSRLRAQSYGTFPGPHGLLYRNAVIGSGGHRIITRRLLRQIAERARSQA